MSKPSFSIQLAMQSDIPNLAKVAGDAFESDRHTQMKGLGKKPYNHEEGMKGALAHWLTRPQKCTTLKATDNKTGEAVGWVCWGFHGYEEKEAVLVADTTDVDDVSASKTESKEAKVEAPEDNSLEQDPIERLEAMTDADMEHWMDKLMPENSKCMYIVSIVVAPAYQSRGIGSALIQWGTSRADADGVYCWVHASEMAHTVFAKEDFEQVGRLEVDLDEYAPAPCTEEGGDGRWGRYTFRYMKRMPKVEKM